MIEPLNIEKANAHHDADSQLVYITYRGALDADTSVAVYDWLGDLIQDVGIENLQGEIFDFREVTEFMPDNLMQARSNSRRYNMRNKVRHLPVAMIVDNHYHEEILRGPMQNVEENRRKRIVHTMDEARAFIWEWHREKLES